MPPRKIVLCTEKLSKFVKYPFSTGSLESYIADSFLRIITLHHL